MMTLKCMMIALNFAACTEVSISKTYQPDDTAFPADVITEADDTIVDTDETDVDTDTDDSGSQTDLSKSVGYVELGLMQASCPYCLGVPQEINITAYARFHNPTGASHTSWLPQTDGCRDYYETTVSSPNVDMGSTVTLQNNFGDNIALSKTQDNTGVIYENGYLLESKLLKR